MKAGNGGAEYAGFLQAAAAEPEKCLCGAGGSDREAGAFGG